MNQTSTQLGDGLDWGSQRSTLLALGGSAFAIYLFHAALTFPYLVKAPVVGKRGLFTSEWLSRLTYSFNAKNVLYEGYKKVGCSCGPKRRSSMSPLALSG